MKIFNFKQFSIILILLFTFSCDLSKPEKSIDGGIIGASLAVLSSTASQAATNTSYPSSSPFTFTAGQEINLSPSSPTSGSTYSVSPSFPTGITLNQSTGVVSGSSSVNLSSTTYTITQTRPDGSTTTWTLIIEITGGTSSTSTTTTSTTTTTTTTTTSTPITNHTIGGSITGNLNSGTVILRLNGSNNLSKSALGTFTFGTTVSTNNTYTVTVFTQPTTSSCGVTSNGTGTIVSSDITNVAVTCNACGDGVTPSYQPCDDGNTASGDGCSASCTVESGWTCTSASPSICSM